MASKKQILADPTAQDYEKENYLKLIEKCKHSTELWSQYFTKAAWQRKQGPAQQVGGEKLKNLRVMIFQQTESICKNLCYTATESQNQVLLSKQMMHGASTGTQMYGDTFAYDAVKKHVYKTIVQVVQQDCLLVGQELQNQGAKHVAVLNMANASIAGGGVRVGHGAQEENLHRRGNLVQCLQDPQGIDEMREWSYPIPSSGGIFTPKAVFFRGLEQDGYPFLEQPYTMSILSVAAIAKPKTIMVGDELRLTEQMVQVTRNKIRAMLLIAAHNKVTSLVLSALGCGAFGNPPKHMAELCKQVLEDEFAGAFEHVYFAIIEDHNSNRAHNPNGNFAPFAQVFSKL